MHFLHKYSHTHFSICDTVHFKTYLIFVYKKQCHIVSLEIIYDQHNQALGTTTSRAICDVNGNDYYFYASRRDLMLEIGYFSSPEPKARVSY